MLIGVYAFLVVTPKKTCGFGATPGFGGDTPLFFGFGGDFFSALMVVTKNHPHVVVTSTNRATFGGDKALSAKISLVFSGMVVTSAGFGGDKAPRLKLLSYSLEWW